MDQNNNNKDKDKPPKSLKPYSRANSAVTRMRPLLFIMLGSNIIEIRTETVKLSAYWARPASSSGASFFALWSGTKASAKLEGLVTRREGPKKGEKGEAKRLPNLVFFFFPPLFVRKFTSRERRLKPCLG